MKTDRHSRTVCVKLESAAEWIAHARRIRLFCLHWVAAMHFLVIASMGVVVADDSSVKTLSNQSSASVSPAESQPQATELLRYVLRRIAHGPAFDALVRETVWATGREVVGIGSYEQAGVGSGRFNLQITMHDGYGKHWLQQISDGRLAWTRSEISGQVKLRRVDLGRLDEGVGTTSGSPSIAPRLKVGGWTEMLDTIDRDYILRVDGAKLQSQPVWVITGTLRKEVRARTLAQSGRDSWSPLCPTKVRVAISSTANAETGFGDFLPLRIESWSDPIKPDSGSDTSARPEGRLIALIEIHSIRPIKTPPVERFRFNNDDAEVNFTNDTDRYIQRHGVQLTAKQQRLMSR